MGIKIFGPGGIDQKSSHLVRDPRKLRDARNIMLNQHGEYVKRPGSIGDANFSGNNYSDMIYIRSLDEYFFRDGTNYYRVDNGVKTQIAQSPLNPTTVNTSLISSAEYLNTLIFTHIDSPRGTFVYDGRCIYFAGLPAPADPTKATSGPSFKVAQSGTAHNGFALVFYDFIDNQGNEVFGPSQIIPLTNETLTIDSANSRTLKNSGFYEGFLTVNGGIQTLKNNTLADRTITYNTISSDIIVGSKLPFRYTDFTSGIAVIITEADGVTLNGRFSYVMLEVESIDTVNKKIVFTANSFNNKIITISSPAANVNALGSVSLRIYFSESEVTGYVFGFLINIDNSTTTMPAFVIPFNNTVLAGDFLLSNVYDITTSKLRPPTCKYIASFGYQIVCGNVSSFFDFTNKETNYTNNDLIMYSDLSTGDIGFNFTESNRQLIGDTFDGEITGLCRSKDSMLAFKNRSIYALDGVLLPGQFSLRKIETNEIGCLSFKSIISTDSYVLFQGQDGIYAINGYICKKFSNELDDFFRASVNPLITRSVVYNDIQKFLFFNGTNCAVYDYQFGEWFIWAGLNSVSGVTKDNNQIIRLFGATSAIKFQTPLNDSGVAINAYAKTTYFDFKEPSILKKVTDVRTFSLNNVGQTIQISPFFDWTETKTGKVLNVNMSSSDTKTVLTKTDIFMHQSFSLMFSNNVLNEDMNITGYEIIADVHQTRDKNVK